MGMQFRKRTKGKTCWWNFSASESRGAGASHSSKLGKNTTINVGSGGRRRLTVNLGNGFRYVKSKINRKPVAKATVASKSKPKSMTEAERASLLAFDVDACLRSIDGDPIRVKKESWWSCENTMIAMLTIGMPAIFILLTGLFGIHIMYSIPIAYLAYLVSVYFAGDITDMSMVFLPFLLLFSPISWPVIIVTGSLATLVYIFSHVT